jgi:mRNA interferase MazF
MARGDILLVTLPESDKREEKGTRPTVAVQADDEQTPMLMVIPLTSSAGASRFAFTVEV